MKKQTLLYRLCTYDKNGPNLNLPPPPPLPRPPSTICSYAPELMNTIGIVHRNK